MVKATSKNGRYLDSMKIILVGVQRAAQIREISRGKVKK
jgi:hypothetical protein